MKKATFIIKGCKYVLRYNHIITPQIFDFEEQRWIISNEEMKEIMTTEMKLNREYQKC